MRQYIYNAEIVNKNFLASYADVIIKDNRMFLVNTLTDRQVLIKGDHILLEKLALKLETGVPDDELVRLLSELEIENSLEMLLREGLIE